MCVFFSVDSLTVHFKIFGIIINIPTISHKFMERCFVIIRSELQNVLLAFIT